MSTFAIVVVVLAAAGGITYFLMKKGKIKDANNNNIPDALEEKIEKAKEVVAETKVRAKKVVEEAKDVVAATKEVVKQSKDVVKAATTKTGERKGRKPVKK
jgi:hypothetical protein